MSYYVLGSTIELGLLAVIVTLAWRWPTVSARASATMNTEPVGTGA